MSANDDIRDALVRRQIFMMRYARGLAARLRATLAADEDIVRARVRRDVERLPARALSTPKKANDAAKRILSSYRELSAERFAEASALAREELMALAGDETAWIVAMMTGALPVVVAMDTPSAREMRAIVTNHPIVGATLGEWLDEWERNDSRRVMEQIRQGLIANETPLVISRRIFGTRSAGGADGVTDISRRNALVFTQTATSALISALRDDVYTRNNEIIDLEIYVATLDSRTSPVCRSLDGKKYRVGKGPRPPVHINCRSLRVPVLAKDAIASRPANTATEAELAGLRGQERRDAVRRLVGDVPAETTYQEFLTRQNAAFQDEVLGRSRGRLFRKGGLDLDSFVDFRGRQYTLDELREREPQAFRRAGL